MLNRGARGPFDKSLSAFSPEGRLFQVEYALEAVRRGMLAVGIKSKGGAIIAIRKKAPSQLMDIDSIEKLFKVDEHIGCAISGLHADSRKLVKYSRVQSQHYKLSYDEKPRLNYLVRQMADIKQMFTQHGGIRPWGSALLFIAVDADGPQLMTTSPSGRYWSWKATAMGSSEEQAKKILEEEYKEDMTLEDIMILGIKIQKDCADEEVESSTLQIGYIDVKDGKFKIATPEKTEEILKKVQ